MLKSQTRRTGQGMCDRGKRSKKNMLAWYMSGSFGENDSASIFVDAPYTPHVHFKGFQKHTWIAGSNKAHHKYRRDHW